MIIGAQLYTVRDFCKTTDALAETLKKVADIGYTEVQLSGVCDYDAAWMADQLKANGLHASITHFAYDRIVGDTEATIAFDKTMDTRYIGLGSIPNFKNLSAVIILDSLAQCRRAAYKISDKHKSNGKQNRRKIYYGLFLHCVRM